MSAATRPQQMTLRHADRPDGKEPLHGGDDGERRERQRDPLAEGVGLTLGHRLCHLSFILPVSLWSSAIQACVSAFRHHADVENRVSDPHNRRHVWENPR